MRTSTSCTSPAIRGSKWCAPRAAPALHFTVETTTPYLGINSHDPNGFLVKMVPPVRTPEHQTALWEGFLEGSINTVGTDNTSRGRASKRPEAGLHGARPGLPALGTHLPALLALRPAARRSA